MKAKVLWIIPAFAVLAWPCWSLLQRTRLAQGATQADVDRHDYVPLPPGSVTFSRDVAPIIYQQCAPCHRAGQSAPFALTNYESVRKHAAEIAEVTQNGSMPPWLPEPGYGEFLNGRRLTVTEKSLLQQWVAEGCREGDPHGGPTPAQWPEGWTLGKPDLVVSMDRAYTLGAEGADVYRNFILPVPLDRDRFVRAIEFVPGNRKIVHHAFIKVDQNRASRRLEAKEDQPGFEGMTVPAEMPDGQFLTWQPGKLAAPGPEDLPWRLLKGSDLILQVHLNRTGKPELLQSSVGLYFSERAPSNTCFKLALVSLTIDIPAGVSNAVYRDSFVLPVEADVLAVLPHAHYLAREMHGYAVLPNGAEEQLLRIRNWNFRWQGDYRYAHPVRLPAQTTLHMEFTYDNSTNNLRNPNQPPQRVKYGPQSSDEMGELWFQILPQQRSDLALLREASRKHMHRVFVEGAEHRLAVNPNDAATHNQLGQLLWDEGKRSQGWQHIQQAIDLRPDLAEAHLNKGILLRITEKIPEAKQELETALRLDPQLEKAYGHLGFVHATLGHPREAERCFLKALELDPNDALIQDALLELKQRP